MIALLLLPVPNARLLAWIPLVIDLGCLPMLGAFLIQYFRSDAK